MSIVGGKTWASCRDYRKGLTASYRFSYFVMFSYITFSRTAGALMTEQPLHRLYVRRAAVKRQRKVFERLPIFIARPQQTRLPGLDEDISRATPGHLTTAAGVVMGRGITSSPCR